VQKQHISKSFCFSLVGSLVKVEGIMSSSKSTKEWLQERKINPENLWRSWEHALLLWVTWATNCLHFSIHPLLCSTEERKS